MGDRNSSSSSIRDEHPAQPVGVDDRQQPALALAGHVQLEDVAAQVGAVLLEPPHAGAEVGQAVEDLGLERLHREQGDEADDRPDADGRLHAVEGQHVVEEPVVLVPQRHPVVADVVHGVGDGEEVLEELGGDVLVGAVVVGQLEGDGRAC